MFLIFIYIAGPQIAFFKATFAIEFICRILYEHRDNDLETKRIRQEEVNSEQVEKQDNDHQQFTLSNQTRFTQNLHPRQTQPETTASNITYWIHGHFVKPVLL